MKQRKIKIKRLTILFEPNWRSRPHPYWFNVKYPDGMRRICLPFFTIDFHEKKTAPAPLGVHETAAILRDAVREWDYLDIGKGFAEAIGTSPVRLRSALAVLKDEGYLVFNVPLTRVGTPDLIILKVLVKPNTTYAEVYKFLSNEGAN